MARQKYVRFLNGDAPTAPTSAEVHRSKDLMHLATKQFKRERLSNKGIYEKPSPDAHDVKVQQDIDKLNTKFNYFLHLLLDKEFISVPGSTGEASKF